MMLVMTVTDLLDTGRKRNVRETFRRRPGLLRNVLCKFNLHSVSKSQQGEVFHSSKHCTKKVFLLKDVLIAVRRLTFFQFNDVLRKRLICLAGA